MRVSPRARLRRGLGIGVIRPPLWLQLAHTARPVATLAHTGEREPAPPPTAGTRGSAPRPRATPPRPPWRHGLGGRPRRRRVTHDPGTADGPAQCPSPRRRPVSRVLRLSAARSQTPPSSPSSVASGVRNVHVNYSPQRCDGKEAWHLLAASEIHGAARCAATSAHHVLKAASEALMAPQYLRCASRTAFSTCGVESAAVPATV